MAKRDYYQVLEVNRSATEAEIKKAYRRLAMKFHPDRNQHDTEAEEKFKEAKEAYEVLTDAQKRAAYDQFGHAGVDAASRGGPGGGGFDPRDAFGDIFGDVFGDIFGGRGRRGRTQVFRGADLRYELELDLEQAVFGDTVNLDFATLAECEECNGSGSSKGSKPVTCETCHGAGPGAHAAGLLHGAADVPALPGPRPGRQRSLRQVPRPGPRAQAEDAGGQGSGGRRHRRSHPPRAAKARRVATAVRTATCTSKCACATTRSSSATARTSRAKCRSASGRRRSAARSRCRRSTATSRSRFRPRPSRAACSACARRASSRCAAGRPGDLFCRVVVETPVHLTREQKELLAKFDESLRADHKHHHPREESWLDGVKRFLHQPRRMNKAIQRRDARGVRPHGPEHRAADRGGCGWPAPERRAGRRRRRRRSARMPACSPGRRRWPSPSRTRPGAHWPAPTSRSTSPSPRPRSAMRGLPRARVRAGDRHDGPQRGAARRTRGDRARPADRPRAQHEPRGERAVPARRTGGSRARRRALRRRDLRGAPPQQGRCAERHGAWARAGRRRGPRRRPGRRSRTMPRHGDHGRARARPASASAWFVAATSSATTG